MKGHPRFRLLGAFCLWALCLGVLCVVWLSTQAFAQDALWKGYLDSGKKAFEEGDYAKAQQQFVAALREAENFGPGDSRLASTLNNLAVLYHTQGKFSEAEPLYRRGAGVLGGALGAGGPP